MSVIIFDFDGTIADSFDEVFTFLRSEVRHPKDYSPQEKAALRGLSLENLGLRLGISRMQLLYTYFKGRREMRIHMSGLKPFAGMPEVIKTLHGQGHHLVIVSSNSRKNIRNFLKQYGLHDYFETIKGAAGVFGKIRLCRRVLVRHKAQPHDCWYIGDDAADIICAKVVGLQSMAVTWGFASPDQLVEFRPTAVANSPTDILKLLQ